jgi:hypothetical protein
VLLPVPRDTAEAFIYSLALPRSPLAFKAQRCGVLSHEATSPKTGELAFNLAGSFPGTTVWTLMASSRLECTLESPRELLKTPDSGHAPNS